MAQNLYCIYVYLTEENRTQFKADYGYYFDEIIFINLKIDEFQSAFFEFSGYQRGLSALKTIHEDVYNIVMINNTFMDGHISLCRHMMLQYLRLALSDIKESSVIGIPNKIAEQRFSHSVSTWCFGLRIRKEDIERFDFTCGYADQDDAVGTLDTIYLKQRALINDWLYPSGFLRGWHKAPYFYDIKVGDYRRKSISILLEHQFISYNDSKISYVHSLSSLLSRSKHKIYTIVMLLDRAYINYKKFAFRISCFVKFFRSSSQ